MHDCLFIQEIVSAIFEELDEYVYDETIPEWIKYRQDESLQTLAALARTCRTFQGPALDILWRDIPDLSVLANYMSHAGAFEPEGGSVEGAVSVSTTMANYLPYECSTAMPLSRLNRDGISLVPMFIVFALLEHQFSASMVA